MIKFIKSIFKSMGRGVANDPEVRRFLSGHPRLAYFVRQRFTPDEKFGLHLTIGVVITLIFIYIFFNVVESFVGHGALIQSDLRIINLIQILRTPVFNSVMLFITCLGNWRVVFSGVLAVGLLLWLLNRRYYLIALIASVGGGEIFVWIVKHIIERPRPPLVNALAPESGFSFPSGHSFVALAFYGFIFYYLSRAFKNKFLKILSWISGIILIIAIGFSRIYLGVHWPSDVLASYASGAAWLAAIITALETRRKFADWESRPPRVNKKAIAIIGIILFIVWGFFIKNVFKNSTLKEEANIEKSIIISEKDIPEKLFESLPKMSENISGGQMEPINMVFVGKEENLKKIFKDADWVLTDKINYHSLWRLIFSSILNDPYPQAPGIPSFWNTYPNDFAFEQPTKENTVRERHHIHFWKTPFIMENNNEVWFGTAHFDKAIKLKSAIIVPSHIIDPAVDKERNKIKNDISNTGEILRVDEFQIVEPMLGENQAGDQFFTDGKAYVIYLK